jgi:hypothetical protein
MIPSGDEISRFIRSSRRRRRGASEKRDELAALHARPQGSEHSIITGQNVILKGVERNFGHSLLKHCQCRSWSKAGVMAFHNDVCSSSKSGH